MALNESRRWLIAYDIREPRRLGRVHRFLTRVAVPVQYSVFAASDSQADMRRLAERLRALIDEGADDVRIYSIPIRPFVYTIGRKLLPEDAWLFDAKTDLGSLLESPPAGCTQRSGGVSCGKRYTSGRGPAKCATGNGNLTRSA